jgi:FkbM family methyltransferase
LEFDRTRLWQEIVVLLKKAKSAIKSSPLIYNLLLTAQMPFRRQGLELARLRLYCSTLPRLVQDPTFVKVGANDGVTGDPVSDILLADKRWKGLLIEPVPYCFERLKQNFSDPRRFTLERIAIGPVSGHTTFYYVDQKAAESLPELPSYYDQLGSFDRNHIVRHLNGVLEPFIVASSIEVCPLEDSLNRNGIKKVHFLHIDAEGYDYEVLKTLDFNTHTPEAILIEHKHLSPPHREEMLSCLRDHGYSVDDCGGDYFAVHERARLAKSAKGQA